MAAHLDMLKELRSILLMGVYMLMAWAFCFDMDLLLKCVKRELIVGTFSMSFFFTVAHAQLSVSSAWVLLKQGVMELGGHPVASTSSGFGSKRPGAESFPQSKAAKRHKPDRSLPPQRCLKSRQSDSSEQYEPEEEEEQEEEEDEEEEKEAEERVRKKRPKRRRRGRAPLGEDAVVRIENGVSSLN